MKMFLPLVTVLAALFSLGAQANPIVSGRNAWFFNGGYFVKGIASQSWSQTVEGQDRYQYVEDERTNQYVGLYDASRKLNVRLYADRMEVSGPTSALYDLERTGHWDDRRIFVWSETPQQKSHGMFQLYAGQIYKEVLVVNNKVTNIYYREQYRDDQYIQILNPQNNLMLTLTNGEVDTKTATGFLRALFRGNW